MKRRQVQAIPSNFITREEEGDLVIEGYFAVFNSTYNVARGMTESIAEGAFTSSLDNDVRALVNHDTTLVLGRTKSKTLELKQDDHGLWGRVRVNPNDSAAMDLYSRVKRGDVDGCSFGFDIIDEDTEVRDNGDVHWTIKDIELYEVSCCTFPAYDATNIEAREAQKNDLAKRKHEAWKASMHARLKGEKHGTESPDA